MAYQNDNQPVWQPYVDLTNDVKPFMQWPTTPNAFDAQLQETIDAACWWVQDFMSRPIAPTEFFRRFNGYSGWGGSCIDLPYYPVIVDGSRTMTVTEWWGNSGPHTLVEQTPAAQGGSDMYTLDPLRGIITRSYKGLLARPTFPGLRNIEVTWWAGFNPIPKHWRRGTLRLIKHWWTHDQQAIGGFQRSDEGHPMPEHFPLVPDDIEQIFTTGLQVGLA